jgi:hypothetical protein
MLQVLGTKIACLASGARATIGSWLVSIHPRLQLIFGWNPANQGYPRMILFSPRLVRKNCIVVCCALVCTARSM